EVAPGRYEATFRPDAVSGALLLQASLGRAGAPVADGGGRLTLPFAPELRPRPPAAAVPGAAGDTAELTGPALPAAVAARTGSRPPPAPPAAPAVFDPGPETRDTSQPIRTPILLATLALLVLDVLLRRVRLGRL